MIKSFYKIVDDVKRKPYDLLDYTRNQFDRDYLEFNVNIHDLEIQLQVRDIFHKLIWDFGAYLSSMNLLHCFCLGPARQCCCAAVQAFVNVSFENITSTDHALSLLAQFNSILQRDALKQELESKYQVRASTCFARPSLWFVSWPVVRQAEYMWGFQLAA